jgi:hypothetical protein
MIERLKAFFSGKTLEEYRVNKQVEKTRARAMDILDGYTTIDNPTPSREFIPAKAQQSVGRATRPAKTPDIAIYPATVRRSSPAKESGSSSHHNSYAPSYYDSGSSYGGSSDCGSSSSSSDCGGSSCGCD